MVKIRNGMFETNSSSTHTIIVTDSKTEPGLFVDFSIGEFGWEFRKISSITEKASYLYTLACEQLGRDVYQDLYEILIKYGVKCTCFVPAKFVKSSWSEGEYLDNGYVDHCYEDDAKDFVERMLHHEKALIKYLFSDESFVVTGNDNCDEDQYEWMQEQTDVDYPHKTYYKGN